MHNQIRLLKERSRTAQAVVFDMDGVLIDSEKHHFMAHQKALAECGVEIDKPFYVAEGISTDPAIFYARAFRQAQLPMERLQSILSRKRQIYKELQQQEGVIPVEPAIALARTLSERKIPLAIASAVPRDEVNRIMQHLGIDRCFAAVVGGGDFPLRNKPFPDIYLKAAELLAVNPTRCIAIEDSGNGATAAMEAGMTCVVVPNEYTATHDFGGAIVLSSFSEIKESIINVGRNP